MTAQDRIRDRSDGAAETRGAAVEDRASTGRRAAVIYNPIKVELDELRAAVVRAATTAGWAESLWIATTEEDPGQGAAHEALEAGVDMVVAAGGDGTIRAVAEVLGGTGIPLALLPAGTGNLLARNLKLTLNDVDHAVDTAFAGTDRDIDLARITIRQPGGATIVRAFLVMAGVGLDAQMLASTDDELKAKVGWLAYAGALVKTLRDSNRINMYYRVDGGRPRRVFAHTAIVGNCGTLAANVLLLPEAVVDDGILDAVFIKPSSLRGWLQVFRKVFWHNGVVRRLTPGRRTGPEVDAVNYVRAGDLEVTLAGPEEIELDGDPMGDAVGFRVEVEHGGLRIRVPADAARDEQE
jgi:diacylglycerol kinase family enzyme